MTHTPPRPAPRTHCPRCGASLISTDYPIRWVCPAGHAEGTADHYLKEHQ